MIAQQLQLYPKIASFCQNLEQEFELIPSARISKLILLADYIEQKVEEGKVQLNVICTHNSRRSHIGQLCLALAADYYDLPNIETFSGGTSATAVHINTVTALQQVGFQVSTTSSRSSNPIYKVNWRKDMKDYTAFSKHYADDPNPKQDFGAILVCSEADEACPTVFGCDFRIALPYDDPKKFDGTCAEAQAYQKCMRQIGREMLFVLSQVETRSLML